MKEWDVLPEHILELLEYIDVDMCSSATYSQLYQTHVKTKHTAVTLLEAAQADALIVSKREVHKRTIPDEANISSLEQWFTTDGEAMIKIKEYLLALMPQLQVIAKELILLRISRPADYEYHRLKTLDLFMDFQKIAFSLCALTE